MPRCEVFPPELMYADKVDEAVAWINAQDVPRLIDRKYLIIDWCQCVGIPLTAELVDRVYLE